MTDWIEWAGGDCPVAKGTLVDVKYRNGQIARRVTAGTSHGDHGHVHHNGRYADDWSDEDSGAGIAAYRLSR